MNKTTNSVIELSERLAANTETLAESLDCGRATAVKIGEAAGAKIQIGRRVLWNVSKVKQYLNCVSIENGGDFNGV